MKMVFFKALGGGKAAVADLLSYGAGSAIVSRINVPPEHRGKGVGRALLEEIIKEADETGTMLVLFISPSGGLNYTQLKAWYERHGFKPDSNEVVYTREAKSNEHIRTRRGRREGRAVSQ